MPEVMSRTERHRADQTKAAGVHYTPPELAGFLASTAFRHVRGRSATLRILDPACGDGALLAAAAQEAVSAGYRHIELVGMDLDGEAIALARRRLVGEYQADVQVCLECADFLDPDRTGGQLDLLAAESCEEAPFDLVIANPPYVRTQTLGATQARELARRFGLTGRVDLYHAFALQMTAALSQGGVLALLCSNRFMTTKSGEGLREHLRSLDLREVFDLGDTQLFGAAVLPAVTVAVKGPPTNEPEMHTAYEDVETRGQDGAQVLEALAGGIEGRGHWNGRAYRVRHGLLSGGATSSATWRLIGPDDEWVLKVEQSAWRRLGDLWKVRVGVKTTADSIFIREDWGDVRPQPEEELLLPLLTHHAAVPWRGDEVSRRILYPYDLSRERRTPLDMGEWRGALDYLEQHRSRLEARRYVIDAGREWWELWVPQKPALWNSPKIVFPDISDTPRFFFDESGAVVNGDCYWMHIPDESDQSLSLLAMGIANSSLGTAFYDIACGNKLYSGRRRYITQYVERFPLPDPTGPVARQLIDCVARLIEPGTSNRESTDAQMEVDRLAWGSFGLKEQVPR